MNSYQIIPVGHQIYWTISSQWLFFFSLQILSVTVFHFQLKLKYLPIVTTLNMRKCIKHDWQRQKLIAGISMAVWHQYQLFEFLWKNPLLIFQIISNKNSLFSVWRNSPCVVCAGVRNRCGCPWKVNESKTRCALSFAA